jgi:hypothetical protein
MKAPDDAGLTWFDVFSILLDLIFSPSRRVVKMGDSVYFLGTEGVYRYGPKP